MSERFVVENKHGDFIILRNSGQYLLKSFDGLSSVEPEVHSVRTPYQDGETYLDSFLEPREFEFDVIIMGNVEELRREFVRVFNPKDRLVEIRYYSESGKSRLIEAYVSEPIQFRDYHRNMVDARVRLVAPEPYWKSLDEIIHILVAYTPKFKFPLQLSTKFGIQGDFIELNNIGDVPTPVELTIHGYIDEPKLKNVTTGEEIGLNMTIDHDERVEINTEFGNKRVEHIDSDGNRTNVFHKITLETKFWSLAVGKNRLEYESLEAEGNVAVYIKKRRRYLTI